MQSQVARRDFFLKKSTSILLLAAYCRIRMGVTFHWLDSLVDIIEGYQIDYYAV